jgi:sigma-B regulation protein RsbU (phosphoserine phosphatase)
VAPAANGTTCAGLARAVAACPSVIIRPALRTLFRSLLATLPGRLFLLASGLFLALAALRLVVDLPAFLVLLRQVVSLACVVALVWLGGLALVRNRRVLLWRVRRKLILSYVFLGLVPVALIAAFVLAGGVLLYMTVAQYVFQAGFTNVVEDVEQIAETTSVEIGRTPGQALAVIERKYANLAGDYAELSLAVVPVSTGPGVKAGTWAHVPPVVALPPWVVAVGGFAGTLVFAGPDGPEDQRLFVRAVVPTPDATRMVVADLPIDSALIARLRDRTGTGLGTITVSGCGVPAVERSQPRRGLLYLFQETVAFMDCVDWPTGRAGGVSVNLEAPVGRLYDRLAAVSSAQVSRTLGGSWTVFLQLLVLLGILFLIIQGSALVMGALLARSITSAVHELFLGTERIQQGDFTHRIRIDSRDQLGDLADSFNRMSGSIEHLLHVQREKQRLDDELRIAREIQKSLLPVHPPAIPLLDIAAVCEPAREVGGDYYDFFVVGPRQVGVLIADVSGKGTSAALYMAELKGLMLALSQTQRSPRRLLIDVNRLLADHLDNRSFITMTYVVVDLDAGTLTSARAGHTPLIVASAGRTDVVTSDGMVLGLRLPGAGARFEQLLAEDRRPVRPGDAIVLYTDGVTEAMDGEGELFGDAALTRAVTSHQALDATALRDHLVDAVKAFVGEAEPHDDMTMVVLKIQAG